MKPILYDMGFFCVIFEVIYLQTQKSGILEAILNSLNNVSKRGQRGGGVIIGKNILLVYFMFQSI